MTCLEGDFATDKVQRLSKRKTAGHFSNKQGLQSSQDLSIMEKSVVNQSIMN